MFKKIIHFIKLNYSLLQVKKDGYALEFIQDQTLEICLAAVQKDGNALEFVKEQTESICLAAVQNHGIALYYVNEQTPSICLAAVKQNWRALYYVKDLHSIADQIDESIISKGLKYENKDVVLAYQKLVKIREANAVANRINDGLESVQCSRPKVKL